MSLVPKKILLRSRTARYSLGFILCFSVFASLPAQALAALVYVGGVHGNRTGSTSAGLTLSLTALTGGVSASAAEGDIVVIVVSTGSTVNRNIGVSTAGYTELNELYSNNTDDTNLSVSYKIMGSSPDTQVVTLPSGSAQDALSATVQVWRGVDQDNPFDVASTSTTGTGTARPTPPPITPVNSGAIIIAIGAGAIAGTGAVYTTATLSNFQTDTGADTNDSMTGMGSFEWTDGTYTPAQFGGGTTGAGDSWAGMTVALREAVTPSRQLRLFEGFILKIISGTIKILGL